MAKVILSSKESDLLNRFFRASGASLTDFACGYEEYKTAISVLNKIRI